MQTVRTMRAPRAPQPTAAGTPVNTSRGVSMPATSSQQMKDGISPPNNTFNKRAEGGARPESPNTPSTVRQGSGKVENVEQIRWRKGEKLGQGAFGAVYKGIMASGRFIAVKCVPFSNAAEVSELEKEVNLLRSFDHPNIVRYVGTSRDADYLYIMLEYVAGGTLTSVAKNWEDRKVPEETAAVYLTGLLRGLAYLHSHGVVHRDIKGANVLVGTDGTVKLADFGTGKNVVGNIDGGQTLAPGAETVMGDDPVSFVGTPYFMPPETITQSVVSRRSDIWSVGATAIEPLDGRPPWSNLNTVTALFQIANPTAKVPIPAGLSPQCAAFLERCFQRDPKKRPTASELLDDPFLQQYADLVA